MKFVSFVLSIAAFAITSRLNAETHSLWTNPLIEQRADPSIHRHTDGYYYLTATVPEEDRIELRRATSLAGLGTAEAKVVWRRPANGPMGGRVWAPEIHFLDGKWYLYVSAGDSKNPWAIRLYVLENTSANPLEGTWVEKGRLDTGWDTFALDATVFEHAGKRYLVWAQADPKIKVNSNLYIAAMDTPWSIQKPAVMLSSPEYPWECVRYKVNEGPAVIQKNGRVFIAYSASCIGAEYCLGLLTASESSDLLNAKSWSKSPTPVFATSKETNQYGPGHNCFTTTADGNDVLVYHDRSFEVKGDPLKDPNRRVRAQFLKWKSDGSPDFGIPVADGPLP